MRAPVHEKVRVSFLLRGCCYVHLRNVLVRTFGALLCRMHLFSINMLLLRRAYRGRSRRIMVQAIATVMHVAAAVAPLLHMSTRHLLHGGCLLYETLGLVGSENHRLVVGIV